MNKIITIIAISFFSLVAQTSDDLLEEGKKLLNDGFVPEAQNKLLELIEAEPNVAEAHFLLSKIYLRQYDLDKTRESLRKAIDNDQSNQEYRDEFDHLTALASSMASAMRALNGGDPEGAIAKFEKVNEDYAEFSAAGLYYIGVAYMRSDDSDEASKFFQEAMNFDPNYDKPKEALKGLTNKAYNEGNKLLRRGDYEGAEDYFNKVLDLDPNYYQANFQLGYLNTKLGDYDLALEQYTKTVENNPGYSKGWFALGLTHQRNGDYDNAIKALDSAINADPNYSKALVQKGKILMKQGDYSAAENALNQAIQIDPSYSSAYADLGQIHVSQERWVDAISSLSTATALDSRLYKGWFLLAQSQNAQSSCEDAKESARSALDVKSDYAPAHYELGIAETCLGNKTAALAAFENARKDRSWRKNAEYEIDKIKNPEKYSNP
tara:strand:- start:8607 stop:9914 length:1308 start_codon:yes stop_codon:yes gene_type:complete